MKAILYIVAILGIGGGIYYTMDNAKKHRKQLSDTNTVKGQIKRINATIDQKQLEEENQKNTKNDRVSTKAEREGSKEQNDKKYNRIVAQLRELDAPIAQKQKELDDFNKAIAEIQDAFDKLNVPGEEITINNAEQKYKELEEKKTGLATKNADLVEAVEKLQGEVDQNNNRIADYKSDQLDRRENLNANSISSLITSVNSDWGFVVIKPHPKSKITEDSNLIVVRGDRHIGRLKNLTLENGRVLANIDFKSLVNGMRIRQGDRVIYAKPATR